MAYACAVEETMQQEHEHDSPLERRLNLVEAPRQLAFDVAEPADQVEARGFCPTPLDPERVARLGDFVMALAEGDCCFACEEGRLIGSPSDPEALLCPVCGAEVVRAEAA